MNTKKELQEQLESQLETRLFKSRFFAMILYPDECEEHSFILNYFSEHSSIFDYIYIVHEPEEEGKKKHVHLLYKTLNQSTPLAQRKFFADFIDYIEAVRDPVSYSLYMIHSTPSSILAHKKLYSVDDVQGSEKLKEKLFGKKAILHNLGNILDLVDTTSGNISLVLRDVLSSCNSDSLLFTLTQYQYLIVNASNQIFNLNK